MKNTGLSLVLLGTIGGCFIPFLPGTLKTGQIILTLIIFAVFLITCGMTLFFGGRLHSNTR